MFAYAHHAGRKWPLLTNEAALDFGSNVIFGTDAMFACEHACAYAHDAGMRIGT